MSRGIGFWLPKHCERNPDKLALVYKEKRYTYEQFNERVNRLAHALLGLGVRKGDRVDALLFNGNELMEALFACAKIGAIFVPINFRLSADEVEYIVQDSAAHHFIYDGRVSDVVNQLRERNPCIHAYIHVGNHPHEQDYKYETLLKQGINKEPGYNVGLEDIHLMMYTSGTTGRPKGAMLSHGNTQWNAINCINYLPILETDITLTVAPLFHIGGMNVFTTPLLYKGGTVILDDKFDPAETLETVERERITTLFLVPAMWMALTQVPHFEQYDLSSLRFNVVGGAPCPITVIEFFQKKGIPFFEGFGLTETAPFVSLLDSRNSLRKNGSVGKTPIHTDARIVDDHGRDVEAGQVGELIVKGPNIMVGYWNKPEATREAIRDGWFHTGDLAKMDEEGFLYIVDRKKDMIISGGENIYPVEVEQVLFRHPNVKEAAVIGVPNEKWGEAVKAVVALKDPANPITLEELRSFCEGKLARYKMPTVLEVVDMLPRNATGKVLKTVLRKQA